MGRKSKKGVNINIHVTGSLCCTAETNTTAEKFMQYQLDVISYEVLNTRFHFVSVFTVFQF